MMDISTIIGFLLVAAALFCQWEINEKQIRINKSMLKLEQIQAKTDDSFDYRLKKLERRNAK